MIESVHERVDAIGLGQLQRNLIAFYFDYPAQGFHNYSHI